MDDILRNFNNKARDLVRKLEITEEDREIVLDIINALAGQEENKLQFVLYPLDSEKRVEYIELANAVIEDIRIDKENEIIENGTLEELETIRELAEMQDAALAKTLDEIMAKEEKSAAPPPPIVIQSEKPPVTTV